MSKAVQGVYAASITPIDPSGDPSGSKLIEHCQWLMEQGVTGVAPLGTTGEGNSLPLAFRLTVPALFQIQAWRRQDDGWCAALPPNTVLTGAQQQDLYNALQAQEPQASVLNEQREVS